MSTTIQILDALQSGLIEAASVAGYPAAVMMAAGTVGTGLASVAAIMSYPGGSTDMVTARRDRSRRNIWTALKAAFDRSIVRYRTIAALEDLDMRMLRDIGLTRGDVLSLRTMRGQDARSADRFVFRPDI
ncbi:hypothetical protein BH10PSE7_BH10PSE7_09160 [soil metagenome]